MLFIMGYVKDVVIFMILEQTSNSNSNSNLTPDLREIATALKAGKKTLEVDADYLVELADFFQYKTNYTIQTLWDSQDRIRRYEERETEMLSEITKLTNKVNELLIDAEIKHGVSEDEDAKHGTPAPSITNTIAQIPLSKVIAFLNKCGNRFGDVYIKLDIHGNFVKFGTSEKELE